MEKIVHIKGNVGFQITIDPSVWIFDDRKLDFDVYFNQNNHRVNELDNYTKSVSKHWDREIKEGAILPSEKTNNTNKTYIKEKLLTSTFGMKFEPFLNNAEPFDEAKTVTIQTIETEFTIPIEEAKELILVFSIKGKPIHEDGPLYVYYGDGRNIEKPIKNVKNFIIK